MGRIDPRLRARLHDRLALDHLPGVVTQCSRTAGCHDRAMTPPALGEGDAPRWLLGPARVDAGLADPAEAVRRVVRNEAALRAGHRRENREESVRVAGNAH